MLMTQERTTLRPEMLAAALDALAVGVVLTASDGQVLYMNAAAARQISAGTTLRLVNNRFSPADAGAAGTLRKMLTEAGNRRATPGANIVVLPDREGTGFLATVLSLDEGRQLPASASGTRAAAIFIQDPSATPQCAGDAFAKLYGLTRGELRVALTLLGGLTLQEVGQALSISLQTVKTHLKHIFQKTGTCRQAELLTLMLRTSGPVLAT